MTSEPGFYKLDNGAPGGESDGSQPVHKTALTRPDAPRRRVA